MTRYTAVYGERYAEIRAVPHDAHGTVYTVTVDGVDYHPFSGAIYFHRFIPSGVLRQSIKLYPRLTTEALGKLLEERVGKASEKQPALAPKPTGLRCPA